MLRFGRARGRVSNPPQSYFERVSKRPESCFERVSKPPEMRVERRTKALQNSYGPQQTRLQ